jgi:amino acid transporter
MATHEAAPPQASGSPGTRLKSGAIGLPGATMQAVATIAPAIAGLFFTQFVVSLTGVTAPLAYVFGVVIVLMLGSTLVQLSKHMSSAGGYYTFVSRAINPRVGFMTAWMYVFYNPVCAGPIYAYFGYLLEQELKAHYGINAPYLWWLCLITGAPFVAFLAWRGLAVSVKVLVGLGLLEMAIVFALAISGFISPGPGGDNLSSWVPSHSLSGEGFALAIVFSLQALTGWEAAAPLAEETTNPRRNIPRATMISIIALGIFLVVVYWGQIIGWGTDILTGSSSKALVNSPDLPGLAIAHRLWGAAWVLVLAAMFSSTLAVCQACNNVSTRIWFKMGETGTLPKWFGKVHPKYRTPTSAILANLVLSLAVGLGVGLALNASRSYFLTNGLILVLAVLYIYVSANVAVAFYYLRQRRQEFNPILHIALPVISTAALIYVTIKSFQPFPSFPYNYAPLIDGIWFAIGLVILGYLWFTKKDAWLAKAGAATVDADVIPEINDGQVS